MVHDVFISYSSKDNEVAQVICQTLEQNDIKCWMAPRDITPGRDYGDMIDEAILGCKVFLFVFSSKSVKSVWCRGELNVAFSEEKNIISYHIDTTPMAGAVRIMLNQFHWLDAYPDYKSQLLQLVQTINNALGRVGIVSSSGNDLIEKNEELLIQVCKNGKWGVLDINGNVLIPLVYDLLGVFSEGLISFAIGGKYGFLDKNGNEVITKIYEYRGLLSAFSEGLAAVSLDGETWGFIDNQNRLVIPYKYKYVYGFSEGLAAVSLDGDKWGFIDKNGNVVIPCKFDSVYDFYGDGTFVDVDDKRFLIDKRGDVLSNDSFDIFESCVGCDYFHEELARVSNGKLDGYINRQGLLIIPYNYTLASDFSEGLAAVSLDGETWGFIDNQNRLVIPYKYKYAYGFSEGLAAVSLDGDKWGFIDKEGHEVISYQLEDLEVPYFHNGLIAVKHNNMWGYIDKSGNTQIPFVFDDAQNFYDKRYAVVKYRGKYGCINREGKMIIEAIYDYIS